MKRFGTVLLTAIMVSAIFTGCGKSVTKSEENIVETVAEDTVETTTEDTDREEPVGMANPWEETDFDTISNKIAGFKFPDDAEAKACRWNESIGLAEIDLSIDGNEYTMRMQNADAFDDISGLYYDWTVEEDTVVGGREGKARRVIDGDGDMDIDNVIWFDVEIGTNYSFTAMDSDLDGYDGEAIVNNLYASGEEFMAEDFLQAREGRDVFDSYEEIISLLIDGEAYAYINLDGYDGDLLVITDATYNNLDGNTASIAGCIYAEKDGKVYNVGNAFSYGTAYPLSCDGKVLYTGGNHEYEEMSICQETGGLMDIVCISQYYDEDGNATYSGFTRESNSFEVESKDIEINSEEEFFAYYDDYMAAPIVNFTVIGQ